MPSVMLTAKRHHDDGEKRRNRLGWIVPLDLLSPFIIIVPTRMSGGAMTG